MVIAGGSKTLQWDFYVTKSLMKLLKANGLGERRKVRRGCRGSGELLNHRSEVVGVGGENGGGCKP